MNTRMDDVHFDQVAPLIADKLWLRMSVLWLFCCFEKFCFCPDRPNWSQDSNPPSPQVLVNSEDAIFSALAASNAAAAKVLQSRVSVSSVTVWSYKTANSGGYVWSVSTFCSILDYVQCQAESVIHNCPSHVSQKSWRAGWRKLRTTIVEGKFSLIHTRRT